MFLTDHARRLLIAVSIAATAASCAVAYQTTQPGAVGEISRQVGWELGVWKPRMSTPSGQRFVEACWRDPACRHQAGDAAHRAEGWK